MMTIMFHKPVMLSEAIDSLEIKENGIYVDLTFGGGGHSKEILKRINDDYSKDFQIFFANGGDQDNNLIPEKTICNKYGIELIDGLGNKIQSSSWILKNKL